MTFKVAFPSVLLSLSFSILIPIASAQQSGQTSSTDVIATDRSSSTGNEALLGRRPPVLYIFGTVVMGDGNALPLGVVIQRSCGGRSTKEASVSPNGSFGFQLGANDNVMADAGAAEPGIQWEMPMTGSTIRWNLSQAVNGCDLRALLGGYRSSAILLTLGMSQQAGYINAGTIFLYPAEKIQGTTVSVTSLAAPGEAKKALARAETAIQKKKIDEAEKHLSEALALYPNYSAAWLRLGQVYERSRRADEARDALAKAIHADANYMSPYIELARLAAMESKWQEAADLTGHALDLNPIDFPEAYFFNALANYNLDKLDAAEKIARKLERIDSMHQLPQTQLVLANILDRKQDFAGEVEELRNYLKYAPKAANAGAVRSRLQTVERDHPALRVAHAK
jgi:tetratricopeptide (TPR) repeat protein